MTTAVYVAVGYFIFWLAAMLVAYREATRQARLRSRASTLKALEASMEATEPKKQIIGPDGEPMVPTWLILGIEKFQQPQKHYRLIWINPIKKEAWLCEEDQTRYRRVWSDDGVVAAGMTLAKDLGVKFSGRIR